MVSLSVVIPCFNAAAWIQRAIKSVDDQCVGPEEIIVVDDGSTDQSSQIAAASSERVRVISQSNAGQCRARNVGLGMCRSRYVFFLDADDYVEGEFVRAGFRALEGTSADVAFCGYWNEKEDGSRNFVDHYVPLPTPYQVFSGWLNHYSQPPCSIVWRTQFIRDIGGWDDRVIKNDDGEVVLRAMLANPKLCHFSGGVGVYNAHEAASVSKQQRPEAYRSEFEAFMRLMDKARGTEFEVGLAGFGRMLYIIARGAFVCGDQALGREALALARSVGLTGHVGTLSHCFLASVLGLEMKTEFASWARSFK